MIFVIFDVVAFDFAAMGISCGGVFDTQLLWETEKLEYS